MPDSTKINSLSVLLDPTGKDFLNALYGKVIDNIQKGTLSSLLKNTDLSGDPTSGSVEAKRFANAQSKAYGSVRTSGAGDNMKAKPVVVQIDRDREIIEEIQQKDIMLYGVDGLLTRRAANHEKTLIRELERAFFQEAADNATALTTTATAIEDVVEALIQQIETTRNDYVDGVDRDIISIVCQSNFYGQLRNYLDRNTGNASVTTAPEGLGIFHGVRIWPSVYLPANVKAICQVNGSVAMPVLPRPYSAERIPLSEAWAVTMFFYYGVKAVTPDLIVKLPAGK
jgi:hypothetical protein